MLRQETSSAVKMQFDSLLEVTDFATNTPRSESWKASQSTDYAGGRSWDLGANFTEALRLARDGWEEGIRQLHALAATVPNAVAYEQRYGIAGERPDVPRYLAGDPFNMVHRGKVRKPKPGMTLVISIGANCNVNSRDMWNYGAAMTALIDRLESRGVRVEVIGCWTSQSYKRFSFSWTVKRREDALDLSAIAFGLAHPAMLRRIGFAIMERSDMPTDVGYGRSQSKIKPEDLVDAPDGALFIGGVGSTSKCHTMAGALEYAKAEINAAFGEDVAELEELEA